MLSPRQFSNVGNRMACTCGYRATSLGNVVRVEGAGDSTLTCMWTMASGLSPLMLTTPRYREAWYGAEMESVHPDYMKPLERCTDMFIELVNIYMVIGMYDVDAEEIVRHQEV